MNNAFAYRIEIIGEDWDDFDHYSRGTFPSFELALWTARKISPTCSNPIHFVACYPDGREEVVPREVYSIPPSTEEALAFIRERAEKITHAPDKFKALFRLQGSATANPDLPEREQVVQYQERGPWYWK